MDTPKYRSAFLKIAGCLSASKPARAKAPCIHWPQNLHHAYTKSLDAKKPSGYWAKCLILWGGRWGSNPRQQESQSWTLPTELRPPLNFAALVGQRSPALYKLRPGLAISPLRHPARAIKQLGRARPSLPAKAATAARTPRRGGPRCLR